MKVGERTSLTSVSSACFAVVLCSPAHNHATFVTQQHVMNKRAQTSGSYLHYRTLPKPGRSPRLHPEEEEEGTAPELQLWRVC